MILNSNVSLFRNSEAVNFIMNVSSNYYNFLRVLAYVYRFLHNFKWKAANRSRGSLTIPEIKYSKISLTRSVQNLEFREKIKGIKRKLRFLLPVKLKLYPFFLDKNNLLRVGGRRCHYFSYLFFSYVCFSPIHV